MARPKKTAKRKARRKSGVGNALAESFSEATAWARGELALPVRQYYPPTTAGHVVRTVSIRLPEHLDCRLTALARRRHMSRADVMREALALLIAREAPPLTVGEIAADLIGTGDGPGDLSTNPKHMEGFGRPNRPVGAARAPGRKSLAELFAESPLKGLDFED